MHDVKTTINCSIINHCYYWSRHKWKILCFFCDSFFEAASSGQKHGCTTNTQTQLLHDDFLEISQDLRKVSKHILDSNCSELPKLLTALLRLLQQSLNLNIYVISPFT